MDSLEQLQEGQMNSGVELSKDEQIKKLQEENDNLSRALTHAQDQMRLSSEAVDQRKELFQYAIASWDKSGAFEDHFRMVVKYIHFGAFNVEKE